MRTTEAIHFHKLIEDIVSACPARRAGTEDERRAQLIAKDALEGAGLQTEFRGFEFNDNLYEVLALHFGLGALGTLIAPKAPRLAAALHALVAASYFADSTRSAYILRSLLPKRTSQNLLAVAPAIGECRLRIVLPAHIDSAPTGWLFDPKVVTRFAGGASPEGGGLIHHGLRLATGTEALQVATSLLRTASATKLPGLRSAEFVLAIPSLISFVLNAQVAANRTWVPGANDNLTGVASLTLLANRLRREKPDDVELVFVVTGCEEAGTGGAYALAKQMRDTWSTDNTVVLGLDSLSNGDLFYFQEAEIVRLEVPERIESALHRARASDPRFSGVRKFTIPVGASDSLPFLVAGYDAATIGCVDLAYGAPRHYHHPTDTLANVDIESAITAVDFAEQTIRQLWTRVS